MGDFKSPIFLETTNMIQLTLDIDTLQPTPRAHRSDPRRDGELSEGDYDPEVGECVGTTDWHLEVSANDGSDLFDDK